MRGHFDILVQTIKILNLIFKNVYLLSKDSELINILSSRIIIGVTIKLKKYFGILSKLKHLSVRKTIL